jgi:hypothetical protein
MKLIKGKVIKMAAMRPGPCKYSDEMVYLSPETLAKMAETAHGIPVVINHVMVDSGNVETVVVGRVADFHPTENGEWDAHFVVDDSDAVAKLESGWGISTAYRITESGPAGTFNAIPYDREVLNATYEHLAIVANPRYEMAVDPVFYNGVDPAPLQSTPDSPTIKEAISIGGIMLSKLFTRKREEVKVNDAEDLVVEHDGKEISVIELIKKNACDEDKYNSLLSKYNELEEKYNALMKKNAEDEEKKKEEEEKKNAEDEEKKEKEKEEKENSVHFNSLEQANAKAQSTPAPVTHMSLAQMVEAGKAAYGKK